MENFHEFFRSKLALKDYKGVFWPKTRAKTMTDKESRSVDGCAIFYKNSKYVGTALVLYLCIADFWLTVLKDMCYWTNNISSSETRQ